MGQRAIRPPVDVLASRLGDLADHPMLRYGIDDARKIDVSRVA